MVVEIVVGEDHQISDVMVVVIDVGMSVGEVQVVVRVVLLLPVLGTHVIMPVHVNVFSLVVSEVVV